MSADVPEVFGGDPNDLSLLPLYANHATKDVRDIDVKFIHIYSLTCINHDRKIATLQQLDKQ